MPDETYDPLIAIFRVAGALESLDARVAEVLALHFALEREVDAVLSKLVLRSEKLVSVGFLNKIRILHAIWPEPSDKADKLFNVLNKFNDLRNAIAHGSTAGTSACRSNLIIAYQAIEPEGSDTIGYSYVAQGICLFMGGGPMPTELKLMVEGLHQVIAGFADAFRIPKTTD